MHGTWTETSFILITYLKRPLENQFQKLQKAKTIFASILKMIFHNTFTSYLLKCFLRKKLNLLSQGHSY